MERPIEDFNRRRARPAGIQQWCRACAADHEHDWRVRTAMTVTVERKRCPQCDRLKSASEFYRNRSRRDGLSTACKPCAIAQVIRSQRRRRNR